MPAELLAFFIILYGVYLRVLAQLAQKALYTLQQQVARR
jgi:hypothetical protein